MFEGVPEDAGAYVMAAVIQSRDDDRGLQILGNSRRAMKEGGRVLVVKTVIPGPKQPHLRKLADIELLIMTDGGRERTREEYQALYKGAGLRVTRVVPTNSPWSIVEGVANKPGGTPGRSDECLAYLKTLSQRYWSGIARKSLTTPAETPN